MEKEANIFNQTNTKDKGESGITMPQIGDEVKVMIVPCTNTSGNKIIPATQDYDVVKDAIKAVENKCRKNFADIMGI